MSILSRFWSKPAADDYEAILSSLALDIQKRQTRLSELRLRERRTTLLLTIYAYGIWAAYVGLWYTGWLPHVAHSHGAEGGKGAEVLKAVPIVVGPILIQFTRRIVQAWYTRKGNAEEKTLKNLLAKQHKTVEDIKQKTNYYSTKNLLERYDHSAPSASSGPPSSGVSIGSSSPTTPVRRRPVPGGPGVGTPINPNAPGQSSTSTSDSNPLSPSSPSVSSAPPAIPPRKQWYDKVADALLGDDEFSSSKGGGSDKEKYALICGRCFGHNGLVVERVWEDTQYVCPKCGYFNPSPRSLRAFASSANPNPNAPSSTSPPSSGSVSDPTSPEQHPSQGQQQQQQQSQPQRLPLKQTLLQSSQPRRRIGGGTQGQGSPLAKSVRADEDEDADSKRQRSTSPTGQEGMEVDA